jgi:putative transposase
MSKSRHMEAQIIGALKQIEAGRKAEDVTREVGVSKHTIYAWKAKYGGMDVSQAQEAKQLRDENTRLRKLVAEHISSPSISMNRISVPTPTIHP